MEIKNNENTIKYSDIEKAIQNGEEPVPDRNNSISVTLICCIFPVYFVLSALCGISAAVNECTSIGSGIVYVLSFLMFGLLMIPAYAAQSDLMSIISLVIILSIIAGAIFFYARRGKYTKKEKLLISQAKLTEKEFEITCPEVVEKRKEIESLIKSRDSLINSLILCNNFIKSTSPEMINRSYIIGKITIEEHDSLMEKYEMCSFFVSQFQCFEENYNNMIKQKEEYISNLRDNFYLRRIVNGDEEKRNV